ncbi:hypothetical protein [Dactylosporangium sp. CA-092794]|uniref:hypothetical protein n=1 Tax=Dactylosporangium sp. CA-092794 TaxID=3239929 RepID=UPI003D8F8861
MRMTRGDGYVGRRRWSRLRPFAAGDAQDAPDDEEAAPPGRRRTARALQAVVVVAVAVPATLCGVQLGVHTGAPDAGAGQSADPAGTGPVVNAPPPAAPGAVASATDAAAGASPAGPPAQAASVAAAGQTRTGPAEGAAPPAAPGRTGTNAGPVGGTGSTTAAVPAAPKPAAAFAPIPVQAEDPANYWYGAGVQDCVPCDGGKKVQYIGDYDNAGKYLLVYVDVPAAGSWPLTVTYETDTARSLRVSVSGGSSTSLTLAGAGWTAPRTARMTLTFPAGRVTIRFDNPSGRAPDVDKIVVGG